MKCVEEDETTDESFDQASTGINYGPGGTSTGIDAANEQLDEAAQPKS